MKTTVRRGIGSKFRGVGDEIATITGFRRDESGRLIVRYDQHDRWNGGTYHGEDFAIREDLYEIPADLQKRSGQ